MLAQYPRLQSRGLLCCIFFLLMPACSRRVSEREAQQGSLDQSTFDASIGYRPFLRPSHDGHATKRCMTRDDDRTLNNALSADIPVPVTARLYPACAEKGDEHETSLQVAYVSTCDAAEIYAFYVREMVLYGWQEQLHIAGPEHILLFEKPGRKCVISIRHARLMTSKIARKNRTFFVILNEKI